MPSAPTLLWHGMPVLLLGAALFSATNARASPPDITRYCRTHVHPGIPMSYHMGGDKIPPTCVDARSRAMSRDKKNQTPVDMAVACRLTNGSEEFRYIDGYKIDCSRNPRPLVAEGSGVHIVQPEDLTKYCTDWFGPGARGEYSPALKRTVCTGGMDASPHTVNYALLCDLYYKTDKVRYVDGGDRYYVACLR